MNLPAMSLRYRAVVITFVMLLMSWGIVQYFTMPRREDPEYTVRTCAIITSWPGVPAEKIEELITFPIEKAVDSIDRVDKVRSTTTVGLSAVYVDAYETVPAAGIDNVWDKVRANVSKVRMPEQGITPIVNDEYGDTSIMLVAVYQIPLNGEQEIPEKNRYSLRELDVISQKVRDEIRYVEGVAKVEQYGVQDEAIYIETDLGTWSQLNLTTDELEDLAKARNIITSGGTLETKVGRFSVSTTGEFNAANELNSIIVKGSRNQANKSESHQKRAGSEQSPIYLRDLGLKIKRDYTDPPKSISRFSDAHSSQPCVIVALTMKGGGNITTICADVKARLASMQEKDKTLPPDIQVVPISDQSVNVNAKLKGVFINVVEAVLIVVVVVYLIVGFRSAAVMAANIPIVVLATVALLPMLGVDLEQISLASIIIALGLLVDNAVQVCDQCRTNQMQGMAPVEATITGTNQVAMPMLAGTLTTVAAFLPMLIGLTGSKREYVYSLPVTLSVTLGISWLMAMTFCSLLAAAFIRAPKDPNKPGAPLPWLFDKIARAIKKRKGNPVEETEQKESGFLMLFGKIASGAIRAKFLTVGVAVLLLIGAVMLPIGSEFFPRDNRDQFAVEVWLPENVTIEDTNQVARQVEAMIQKLSPGTDADGNPVERILGMRTSVGSGGARWYLGRNPESSKPNYAEILVRTTDPLFTSALARQVQDIAQKGDAALGIKPIIGARIIPRQLALGPPVNAPIGIRVLGSGLSKPGFADLNTLRTLSDELKDILRNHPKTWDVHDTLGAAGYQLRVEVDEDKANLAGVTNLNVARTLNAYFSGQHLTTFREGDHQVPVYLRLPPKDRGSLMELNNAFVEGNSGKVPLNSFAKVVPKFDPATIERYRLNRNIEVRARVKEGALANDVLKEILATKEFQDFQAKLPSNYWLEIAGEQEESDKSGSQMAVCFTISILLIVLLMVIQYNGWAKPFIILATLPMALIGAFPGLYLMDYPLGFMPQLGLLSLFGIVLNTAIIFFEFADQLIKEKIENSNGEGPILGITAAEFRECLVEAGKQRLLPIFLTTATTVGGLIPLALAGGPLWEGMAWLMIFGLCIATVLTLLVVPAMYAIFVETFKVKPVHVEKTAESGSV